MASAALLPLSSPPPAPPCFVTPAPGIWGYSKRFSSKSMSAGCWRVPTSPSLLGPGPVSLHLTGLEPQRGPLR